MHPLVLVGAIVFKKAKCCVVSKRMGMKFGMIVFQVNWRRLTESNFLINYDGKLSRWRPTHT